MAEITTQFKIADPTARSWSGIFGHRPDNKALRELHGWMFGVMSIKASINFDLEKMAGLLQDELHAAYFDGAPEQRRLEDFEQALTSVSKRIGMIMDRETKLAEKGIDFEMMVAVVRQNVLYIGAVGESKIMVARGDDVAEISGILIDSEMDGFARTGSLEVEPEDRFILLTNDAFKDLGKNSSEEAVSDFDLDSVTLKKGSSILIGYELSEEWLKPPEPEPKEVARDKPEEESVEVEEVAVASLAEVVSEDEATVEPTLDSEVPESQLEIKTEGAATEAIGPQEDITRSIEHEDHPLQEGLPKEESISRFQEIKDRAFDSIANIRDLVLDMASRLPVIGERFAFVDSDENLDDVDEEGDTYDDIQADEELEPDSLMARRAAVSEEDTNRIPDRLARMTNIDSAAVSDIAGRVRGVADTAFKASSVALGTANERIRDLRHGRPGSRIDYVKGGRRPGFKFDARWRVVAVVGVVALVVMVLGVRQAVLDNEQRIYEQGILDQVAEIESEFEKLSLRANTASIGTENEVEKEQVTRELDALAARAESLKSEEISVRQLDGVVAGVQTEKDSLLKINAFTDPQIVTNLAVNFPGVDAVDIEYSEGQLYVADEGTGVIYRTNLNLNSEASIFAAGLTNPRKLARDLDGGIVFLDSAAESALGTIDISDGSIRRQPGISADKLGTVNGMFIWENNGTLYTLNEERPAIVKQASVAGNYQIPGESSVWRQAANLANAVDLAVDGSIYVLINGTGLKRFWAGEPADLTIEGLLTSDVAALQTSVAFELTNNRIYVADRTNQRILVFRLRSGDQVVYDFEEQILYRGEEDIFTDIKDIVVTTSGQVDRVFVLDGEKVIRIDR